jgi:hypothetical protein
VTKHQLVSPYTGGAYVSQEYFSDKTQLAQETDQVEQKGEAPKA